MRYLLDADVLIQAKNAHYEFGVCPGFWDWLDAAHARSRVFSIARVRDELVGGADELADWAKDRDSFFLAPDDAVVASLRAVSAWVTSVQPPYTPAALTEFLDAADYYLVAHAHAHDFAVVTAEVASETRKKVKIPNACRGMSVTHVGVFHMLALDRIRVPENVRALDDAHVKALAGSISLQGMLVPVVVRDAGDEFELVAGFHRVAAARSLGLAEVPVVVRDADTEAADRAVENVTRKQLNPYEEAKAVRAMLDRGLTEDGAAQALGWPKNRVTARVKILELPERAQQLIGEGVIHLAAVDQLRAIGTVAPDLLAAVISYLDDGNAWAAERLMREPGWVLDAALQHAGNGKVLAAYLHSASAHEIAELRLGKKTEQLYAESEKLHKQIDRYAYGPPQVRFTDEDIDQARAAGVLIEFERGRPIIVDRPLYRELVKTAIKRTHDDLQAKAEAAAKDKKTARAGKAPADPVTIAKRERDAQLRELTDQAHGANTDLGHALVSNLATVDPTDITVARRSRTGRSRRQVLLHSGGSSTRSSDFANCWFAG